MGNFITPSFLVNVIDDYLFSGMYAAFPWLSFFLIGLWLVKTGILENRTRQKQFMIGAFGTITGLEFLNTFVEGLALNEIEVKNVEFVTMILASDVFPITPLFTLSATASSILVIMATLSLGGKILFSPIMRSLGNIGRFSLSIYVGHIIMGLGLEKLLLHSMDIDLSVIIYDQAAFYFTLFSIVVIIFATKIWLKFFQKGPL